ncbi:MAG TPA: SGNH/GDSL hydrolase family protein, partial [Polyangiaceae bacterium]
AAGSGGSAGGGGAAGSGGSAGGGGGAAGSGGSAGGGGGAPAYNPCPTNGNPCRIMPLGDSITDGAASSDGGGYRKELFRLALMHQQKLTFVGSHENGPLMVDGVPFPRRQEGHSGWTIADGGGRDGLDDQIQGWLASTPADIVTLMIGTNDVDISLDLSNAGQRLGALMDKIISAAPNALLVVAQIVPTKEDSINQRVMTFNATIAPLVKARADQGKHVVAVDMYGAFTKNPDYKNAYMADILHPKDPGFVVMAQVWYDAFGALLPPQ